MRDRTQLTDWYIEPGNYAGFNEFGVMTVDELFEPVVPAVVRAVYTEGESTSSSSLEVELRIGVTEEEFVRRNVGASMAMKQQILSDLEMVLVRERAAQSVAEAWFSRGPGQAPVACQSRWCLTDLRRAIELDEQSRIGLQKSLESLIRFLQSIDEQTPALPRRYLQRQRPADGLIEFAGRAAALPASACGMPAVAVWLEGPGLDPQKS